MKRKMALRAAVAAVLLLLAPLGALAQGMAVRGVVNDETGEPVIGASVSVKGTTNGAITDMDGRFALQNVQRGATIVVSFVGYATQNVAAAPQLTIVLKEDAQALEDVVVVGYGVQK